jgi:uncharacterized protein
MARVWMDLTNTAHPVVLRPLVELLEGSGHEVHLTARPLSHTVELLDDWGHPYTLIGEYGGVRPAGKARAALDRSGRMIRFGHRRGFAAALAHGSTDLPVACRVLGIPNTTMFDYEWATAQHHLNCRLADRVLVPEAIPPGRLARYGARPPKLVRYPGLKEQYYLHDFSPDERVLDQLGLDRAERHRPLAVVRTPPSYALYLGGAEHELIPALLRRLADQGAQTVVLARDAAQREAVRAVGAPHTVVPDRAVDGRSLVALADLLVSAGGTMNREAAVLGTPVWSMFEGRPGGVDEQLVREGRLRMLADVSQVVIERRDPALSPPELRDPAELLALALPWLARAPVRA